MKIRSLKLAKNIAFSTSSIALSVICVAFLASTVSAQTASTSANHELSSSTQTVLRDVSAQSYLQTARDMKILSSKEVPPILLEKLPSGLQDVSVKDKKAAFIAAVLPSVLVANQEIQELRQQAIQLRGSENSEDLAVLNKLKKRYRAESYDELLDRLHPVPPSLVLAQAILETGWGTSRAATKATNLFGMQGLNVKDGLAPSASTKGSSHKLYIYASILESVRHYLLNLNRHAAYDKFRKKRSSCSDPVELAKTLTSYAELGVEKYAQRIQSIVNYNKLLKFDDVVLQQPSQAVSKQLS